MRRLSVVVVTAAGVALGAIALAGIVRADARVSAAPQGAVERMVIAANLVYSDIERKVLLVNGSEDFATEIGSRVFSWDGRRWTPLGGTGPRVRNLAAAAFDSGRGELVMFGGVRPREPQDDMWVHKNGTWRQIPTPGVGLRDHHVMAYDTHRKRVVLFGGTGARQEGAPRRLSPVDTWEWQGERWTMVATSGPSTRGRSAMVYDEKRREMVLFGGGSNETFGDTWRWDGTRWQQAASGPPARYAHAMAYDSRRGVVIMYGGSGAFKPARYLTDMWEWNGEAWTEIRMPEVNPGPRYSPGLEYDRQRGRLVLYGGIQPGPEGNTRYVFDTWEWDGRRWIDASNGR